MKIGGNLLEAYNRVKRIRNGDPTYDTKGFVTGKVLYGAGDIIEAVGNAPDNMDRALELVRVGVGKIPFKQIKNLLEKREMRVVSIDYRSMIGEVEMPDGTVRKVQLEGLDDE